MNVVGFVPLVFVQLPHVYQLVTVASIATVAPYLYDFALVVVVHPLLTELIHAQIANVKLYVFLSYQHAYVVLLAFAVVTRVAALVHGVPTLAHLYVDQLPGEVHTFDNVKLVPLGIT